MLLNRFGRVFLIDFGTSKHYDESGCQTSYTPVGLSEGYAPLEQYQQVEISSFTPATDIYSLGATLYNLLTGHTPPSASEIYEEGLDRPRGISNLMWKTIESAMQPKRKERPQSIAEFLVLLSEDSSPSDESEDEATVLRPKAYQAPPLLQPKHHSTKWLWALFVGVVVSAIVVPIVLSIRNNPEDTITIQQDTTIVETITSSEESLVSSTPKVESDQVVPGSLKVTSTPAGASIWLDGKDTKKNTPKILEGLSPGHHKVKLVLEGFKDKFDTVTVYSGFTRDLDHDIDSQGYYTTAASISRESDFCLFCF